MTVSKLLNTTDVYTLQQKINEVIDKKTENTATGEDSLTVLGYATNQDYSINIGVGSRANDSWAVALGGNAKITIPSGEQVGFSEGSIAIGYNAETQSALGVSIGTSAKVQEDYAISIGSSSHAYSQGSVAIGRQAETSNDGAIAIGRGAKATDYNAMQLGSGTNNEENTLYIGFSSTKNYKMLDYDGKIPDDRLNNTIARTSQIPTVPTLAAVATSGSYNDLTNKPTIPTVPAALSSFTDDLGSSPIHTHSQYLTSHQDISGKVNIADIASSVSASSTNAIPVGAKLFYDTVGNIETLLSQI